MHKVEIFRFTVVSSNMVSKKQSLRFIPSSISLILLSENNRSARITIEKNKIMSIEKVKAYFATLGREKEVMEFPVSSATVELAAQALSVEPARIAKTLSFQGEDENHCILIVTAGDAKIDNSKFRHFFKMKARMLSPEKVAESTGHAIGRVCPFANPEGVRTYLDISLQRFDTVFPACGSSNSAIELHCDELFRYALAIQWIDVCK